jgi:hypothetical protein
MVVGFYIRGFVRWLFVAGIMLRLVAGPARVIKTPQRDSRTPRYESAGEVQRSSDSGDTGGQTLTKPRCFGAPNA